MITITTTNYVKSQKVERTEKVYKIFGLVFLKRVLNYPDLERYEFNTIF